MTTPKGRPIVEAANYLSAIYRNVAQMLLSCDPMVAEYGLVPYGGSWRSMEPVKPDLNEPWLWAAHRAVRQYHRRGCRDQEIFTIGAYLWDPRDAHFLEPVAVASLMPVTHTNTYAMHWVALLGGQCADSAGRGRVRHADVRRLNKYDDDWFDKEVEFVADGRITTIEVPLLDITTTAEVESRLVRPLFDAIGPIRTTAEQ